MASTTYLSRAVVVGLVAVACGLSCSAGASASALSVGDGLKLNPVYEAYLDDIAIGKGDEWKIIPRKYVQTIRDGRGLRNVMAPGVLPATYSLIDNGYGTPIKDQGLDGSCWAYALTTAMESNLLKTQNKTVDFSPKQMDYLLSSGTPYSQQLVRVFGDVANRAVGSGGSSYIAGYAFGGDYTPIYENDFYPIMQSNDPDTLSYFSTFNDYQDFIRRFRYVALAYGYNFSMPYDKALSTESIMSEKAEYVVTDYTGLSTAKSNVSEVKNSVMENGAVYVGTYGPETANCWDEETKTVVDKGIDVCGKSGHAMAIVGWDDEHTYTDPVTNQTGKGAFILQNSWGRSDLFENVNIDTLVEVLKYQEWFNESSLTEENYQNAVEMAENYDAYEYVYLAYDWEDSIDDGAAIDFMSIKTLEENTYDRIYDIIDVVDGEGAKIGDNANELVFDYSVGDDKKERVMGIAVNDHVVELGYDTTMTLYIDDGNGYIEYGSVVLPAGTFGKKKVMASSEVEISGDYRVKVVATRGNEPFNFVNMNSDGIEEDWSGYFTTSIYTNKVSGGDEPGGDPDPDPDPDPDNPDDPDVPGTGLFTRGLEGALGVVSCLVIVSGFGFVAYRIYVNRKNVFHRVKFSKK